MLFLYKGTDHVPIITVFSGEDLLLFNFLIFHGFRLIYVIFILSFLILSES